MILLLSHPDDSTVRGAATLLAQRGADFVWFDPAAYPGAARLSLRYDAGGALRTALIVDGRRIALEDVTAVWYRRPGQPTAHARIVDGDLRDWVRNEATEVLQALWRVLVDVGRCRFIPGAPHLFSGRAHKPHQLVIAGELGFEIPPTLITNDPDELLAFVREHGRCITKGIDTSSSRTGGLSRRMVRFSTPITHRDLGYCHTVRDCPTLVQAYVDKQVEIRATVVGDRVFAAEIHSQASHRTRYDWRHYDERHTPYAVHELPPEIVERCVALTRRYSLCYGTVDLVLRPDGRYVFLEINYNGQYGWIEDRTGLPITAAICDLLTAPESE